MRSSCVSHNIIFYKNLNLVQIPYLGSSCHHHIFFVLWHLSSLPSERHRGPSHNYSFCISAFLHFCNTTIIIWKKPKEELSAEKETTTPTTLLVLVWWYEEEEEEDDSWQPQTLASHSPCQPTSCGGGLSTVPRKSIELFNVRYISSRCISSRCISSRCINIIR